jgi:ketosteroid isomerase-like protein
MKYFLLCFCILTAYSCKHFEHVMNNNDADKKTSTTFNKESARSFIDSVNLKFTEQFRAGDSAALASHYWPDAEILLANSEAIKGNDILPAWGSMTRMGVKDFTFSTTDITGDNEFIIETGNYEMKDEKKTLVDKGKYVVVWQQRNGEWKLYRDIGNTSLPAK